MKSHTGKILPVLSHCIFITQNSIWYKEEVQVLFVEWMGASYFFSDPWSLSPLRRSTVVLVVKNLLASAGDIRDASSTPGSGRCPGVGHSTPLQYSRLENPMHRGAWWATVHRVMKVRHNWSGLALMCLANNSQSDPSDNWIIQGRHVTNKPKWGKLCSSEKLAIEVSSAWLRRHQMEFCFPETLSK